MTRNYTVAMCETQIEFDLQWGYGYMYVFFIATCMLPLTEVKPVTVTPTSCVSIKDILQYILLSCNKIMLSRFESTKCQRMQSKGKNKVIITFFSINLVTLHIPILAMFD